MFPKESRIFPKALLQAVATPGWVWVPLGGKRDPPAPPPQFGQTVGVGWGGVKVVVLVGVGETVGVGDFVAVGVAVSPVKIGVGVELGLEVTVAATQPQSPWQTPALAIPTQ